MCNPPGLHIIVTVTVSGLAPHAPNSKAAAVANAVNPIVQIFRYTLHPLIVPQFRVRPHYGLPAGFPIKKTSQERSEVTVELSADEPRTGVDGSADEVIEQRGRGTFRCGSELERLTVSISRPLYPSKPP